jgi:ribosome recycling factor
MNTVKDKSIRDALRGLSNDAGKEVKSERQECDAHIEKLRRIEKSYEKINNELRYKIRELAHRKEGIAASSYDKYCVVAS